MPVSKLRAIGELAELGISDLRFSDSELEQLFRETYKRPLEPDVLTELAARTEGWAASLTLVQAALRERSPSETRSFVRACRAPATSSTTTSRRRSSATCRGSTSSS